MCRPLDIKWGAKIEIFGGCMKPAKSVAARITEQRVSALGSWTLLHVCSHPAIHYVLYRVRPSVRLSVCIRTAVSDDNVHLTVACVMAQYVPGVDEHVEEEAPQLSLFVGSVDEQTYDRLRRRATMSANVVIADCRRRVANRRHLIDEEHQLYNNVLHTCRLSMFAAIYCKLTDENRHSNTTNY